MGTENHATGAGKTRLIRTAIAKARHPAAISLFVAIALALFGCAERQPESPESGDMRTETVRLGNDEEGIETTLGDIPPHDGNSGNASEEEPNSEEAGNEVGDGRNDEIPQEIPVMLNDDTVLVSDAIGGRWRCAYIVENGEEAYDTEISLREFPTLVLEDDGNGIMELSGEAIPVRWSSSEDLPRIDLAQPADDERTYGLSGQAWVTRNGMMIWHSDGDGEDSYTLWSPIDESGNLL